MPTVTLTAPADGALIASDPIMDLLLFRQNIVASASVINGLLDIDNIVNVGTPAIDARDTQRKSAVDLTYSAGTANLDYRWTWFGDYTSPTDETVVTVEAYDPFQYIPGGCRSFRMKRDGFALVMWNIFWNNDNYDAAVNTYRSDIVLMVDGAFETSCRRSVNRTATVSTNPVGYTAHRAWCGHALLTLTKGWHNVGLALLADQNIRNTRIHSVSINVLTFNS